MAGSALSLWRGKYKPYPETAVMSRSHGKNQNAFLKRIEKFFTGNKPSQYLEEHGYYDSFDDDKYARSPESFPYLPYSLQDLLEKADPEKDEEFWEALYEYRALVDTINEALIDVYQQNIDFRNWFQPVITCVLMGYEYQADLIK